MQLLKELQRSGDLRASVAGLQGGVVAGDGQRCGRAKLGEPGEVGCGGLRRAEGWGDGSEDGLTIQRFFMFFSMFHRATAASVRIILMNFKPIPPRPRMNFQRY